MRWLLSCTQGTPGGISAPMSRSAAANGRVGGGAEPQKLHEVSQRPRHPGITGVPQRLDLVGGKPGGQTVPHQVEEAFGAREQGPLGHLRCRWEGDGGDSG